MIDIEFHLTRWLPDEHRHVVTFDVHTKKNIWVNLNIRRVTVTVWAGPGVFRTHTYKINEEGSPCKIRTSEFLSEILWWARRHGNSDSEFNGPGIVFEAVEQPASGFLPTYDVVRQTYDIV